MSSVLTKSKEILDESGIDESVLLDLKAKWESKYQKSQPSEYAPHMPVSAHNYLSLPNGKINTLGESLKSQLNQKTPNINDERETELEPNSGIEINTDISPEVKDSHQNSHENIDDSLPKRQKLEQPPNNSEFIDSDDNDFEDKKDVNGSNSINIPKNGDSGTNSNLANIKDNGNSGAVSNEKFTIKTLDGNENAPETSPENSDQFLDSQDDLNETDDSNDEFEPVHVAVCQYDKVARSKTKWNIHLRNGIITVNGKEFSFCKASGVLEW